VNRYLALLIFFAFACSPVVADDRDDCARSNDFPKKVEACSAVIAREPSAGWAYINRSYGYERIGKYEQSLSDGNRAVQFSPQEPLSYVNRAAAYIGLEQYDRAIEDTNRALRLDQGNLLAFVNRAYAYEKLGRRDRAIADYRRCLEIDSSYEYARNALKRLGAAP
jgi:tetratricopeptide (TPR) repeat protein